MENSTAAKIVKTIGIRNINRIFQVIRGIYMLVDYILTVCFGYSLVYGWKKEEKLAKKRPDNYGHLMSIRGRFSHNFAVTLSHENFILRHDSYVDPVDFVLENDCVVLMGLSPTHVSKFWGFFWHFLPTFGQKTDS